MPVAGAAAGAEPSSGEPAGGGKAGAPGVALPEEAAGEATGEATGEGVAPGVEAAGGVAEEAAGVVIVTDAPSALAGGVATVTDAGAFASEGVTTTGAGVTTTVTGAGPPVAAGEGVAVWPLVWPVAAGAAGRGVTAAPAAPVAGTQPGGQSTLGAGTQPGGHTGSLPSRSSRAGAGFAAGLAAGFPVGLLWEREEVRRDEEEACGLGAARSQWAKAWPRPAYLSHRASSPLTPLAQGSTAAATGTGTGTGVTGLGADGV